jgi:acetoin utilization protein AcuC
MVGRVVVTYHPLFDGRGFSPLVTSWSRYRLSMDRMALLGILDTVDIECPSLATDIDLLRSHSSAHLDVIRQGDANGRGTFATSDTPAWRGIMARARAAVGGTVHAARLIASGEAAHVFNPAGGLHHAMHDQAQGFCPFNDLAIAVDHLTSLGLPRVAIVDVDAHHGDGTQELLYDRDVLKVSLHQYDGKYFPGTGSMAEVGWGDGFGLSINVPLPRHVGEAAYLEAFCAIVPTAVRAFAPDVMIVNFGVDGHFADRLSRLELGVRTYRAIAATCHALAHETCGGRLIVTGSGGYNPDVVARCWSTLVATLTGALASPDDVVSQMLHDGTGAGHGRAILGQLDAAALWPLQFAELPDVPPSPNPAAIEACRATVESGVAHVLPLRLAGSGRVGHDQAAASTSNPWVNA